MSETYPYLAKSTIKYKSPHATDLSFAKGETIRVTGPSEEDEDWLIGESLDGSHQGGFPRDFVERVDDPSAEAAGATAETTDSQTAPPAPPPAAPSLPPAAATSAPPPEPTPISATPLATSPSIARKPSSVTSPKPPPKRQLSTASTTSSTPPPASAPTTSPAPAAASAAASANSADPDPEPSKLSFKDRLAAFNKPKGPPPAVKPKPGGVGLGAGAGGGGAAGGGGWSWKQKQAQVDGPAQASGQGTSESSTTRSQDPSTPTPATTTTANEDIEKPSTVTGSGMSASDAKSSIGKALTLKERMAALAGSGAFGSGGGGGEEKAAPPEVKAKPRVWKRPEPVEGEARGIPGMGMAMPGMGGVRSPQREVEEGEGGLGRTISSGAAAEAEANPDGQAADGEMAGAAEGGEEEQDEAAKEKERRANIAARMARLGGRGMFGGPPPTAPKPAVKRAESTDSRGSGSAGVVRESPVVKKSEVEAVAPVVEERAAESDGPVAAAGDTVTPAPSGTSGIAMPSIPKRAGPPRRKAGGASTATAKSPPPAEDAQLAKDTPAAIGLEAEQARRDESQPERGLQEEVAQGQGGAVGAAAAGIAMAAPPRRVLEQEQDERETEDEVDGGRDLARAGQGPILVGAVGGADDEARNHPEEGALQNTRVERLPPPPIPAGAGFGSDDEEEEEEDEDGEDDILKQAKQGQLHVKPSRMDVEEGLPAQPDEEPRSATSDKPVGYAPLAEPADDEPDSQGNAGHVASPTKAMAVLGLPRDEVEMKHDQDAEDEEEDEDDDEAPPPPPRVGERPTEHPSGPRPMPNPPVLGQTKPALAEVAAQEAEDEEMDEEEEEGEGSDNDGPAPLPPPRRQESIPVPPAAKIGVPLLANEPPRSPESQQPAVVSAEPKSMSQEPDEESTRRQNIAARMAKLGGIKLGGPPLARGSGPTSPIRETPRSPMVERGDSIGSAGSAPPPVAAPVPEAVGADDDEEESEDAAAARRRATLARLQAGGHTHGFSMFGQKAAEAEEPVEDTRGIQAEPAEEVEEMPTSPVTAAPRPSLPPPPVEAKEEEEEAPAPAPPPRRNTSMSSRQASSPVLPSSPGLGRSATTSSVASSRRQTSQGNILAPPLPTGPTAGLTAEPEDLNTAEEDDEVGPPPPPRPSGEIPATPAHKRSDSSASRMSTSSRRSSAAVPLAPASPQRQSFQSARPAYNDLQQAAGTHGQKVLKAAQKLAESGRRQSIGDGSSRAFVWNTYSEAGLDANITFGTLIWEQEGGTNIKRYDEPRVGDVVILHDAKLKGKKGLVPYTQSVGSVEEPMFAICAETEGKKNKVKCWQVDRGHVTSESYRLDDLQSGLIRVFRPMPPQ